MSESRSLTSKLLGTVVTRFLMLVLGAATGIVVSRALLPEGRGAYYVLVTVATTAVALGHLSVEQAQVFAWSKMTDPRRLAGDVVVVGLILGGLVAGLAWLIVGPLAVVRVPAEVRPWLPVALAAIPVNIITLYLNGLLVLDGKVGRVNVGQVFAGVLQCAGLVGLALAHRLSPGLVILLWFVNTVLPLVIIFPAMPARLAAVSWDRIKLLLHTGVRYHLGLVATFLLWRIDVFLLNSRVSTADVGLYSLAVTLAELTSLIPSAVAQVTLRRQVDLSMEESSAFTARVVRLNLILSLAGFLGIATVGRYVIPFLYGSAFSGSVAPLIALGPGVVAVATARAVGGYLIRLNRPLVGSVINSGALVLNVALNIALIPSFGIVGASLASSIAYAAQAGANCYWLKRSAGLNWSDYAPRLSEISAFVQQVVSRRPGVQPSTASNVETSLPDPLVGAGRR